MIYNWTLRGEAPSRLAVKPADPWPGNAEAGLLLADGAFSIAEARIEAQGRFWHPDGVSDAWLEHLHGFTWLRDLKAAGGENCRNAARFLLQDWLAHHDRWHPVFWRPDIAAERLCMWISCHDIFVEGEDPAFQDTVLESLTRQARHLAKSVANCGYGLRSLRVLKGLLYAGLALEGHEEWITQSLSLLQKEAALQILADGGHVSRSPHNLTEALRIFLDIRTALLAGGLPVPNWCDGTITRMAHALRFFRCHDRKLPLFNGGQEGDPDAMDSLLAQAGVRGKIAGSLPASGYERMASNRTLIVFSGGNPPPHPFERDAHAAPLAFEFSYGRERMLVSCGSHPVCPDWKDALRFTGAHNTATLGWRNACEIGPDGHFRRKPRNVRVVREDTPDSCLIEAAHDGYVPLFGLTHLRRLYLSQDGHNLRGEDRFEGHVKLSGPVDVAIRFHLHPRVIVSLIRDGQEALLRLPGGIGWRFIHRGGALALEDSVYIGSGTLPRKTKQIVLYGQTTGDSSPFKWMLQRE